MIDSVGGEIPLYNAIYGLQMNDCETFCVFHFHVL